MWAWQERRSIFACDGDAKLKAQVRKQSPMHVSSTISGHCIFDNISNVTKTKKLPSWDLHEFAWEKYRYFEETKNLF